MELLILGLIAVSSIIIFSFFTSAFKSKKNGPQSIIDSTRKYTQLSIGASMLNTKLSVLDNLAEAQEELKLTDKQLQTKLAEVDSLLG